MLKVKKNRNRFVINTKPYLIRSVSFVDSGFFFFISFETLFMFML